MNSRLASIVRYGALCWPIPVILALLWAQVVPCWYVHPDSAVYMELGRNVAAGHGYVYNGEPFFVYPPVFAALLALGIRLLGDSMVMMRAVIALAAMGFLACSVIVVRKAVGWRWALFLTLLLGLSTQTTYRVAYVLSDFPGALMAVLALAALVRLDRARDEHGRVGPWVALAAVLTLLAVATRMANIGIVIGILVQFFVLRADRFSKATLRTALPLAAVPLLGLALWYVARLTTGTAYQRMPVVVLLHDYMDWDSGYLGPAGLAWRVVRNAGRWLGALGGVVISMRPTVVTACLKWAATALFVLGLGVKLMQRRGPIEAFTLGMLLLLLITPFTDQVIERYFLPLGPFLLMYVYEGVAWLFGKARRLRPRTRAVLACGVGAVLLVPVALELGGLRALGGAQHPFGSPRVLLFALAFAASMFAGLSAGLALRVRALMLPASATLLLLFWAHQSTFDSVVWIQRQHALVRDGQTLFITDEGALDISRELRRLAAPDDAVVTSRPALYRGLTDLRTYWFPLTRNQSEVLAALEKGQWILIDLECREDRIFALPVVQAHPERFEVEVNGRRADIYRHTSRDERSE